MPRMARKNFESSLKHVIVQGINKEPIFKTSNYIEKYKKIVLNKLENSNITIVAYCIMNNHAHFLIYSEKIEQLSKYMQKVNTAYSQFYNKANERVGYVFRDRFYSQDILTQKQLYNCLKYIHNNPVKANICKYMHQYKYSSYNEFFKEQKIINDESIKLLFGSTKNYKELFNLIHAKFQETEEDFIEIKDKKIEDFITETEEKYYRKIEEIKSDKENLIKVIKEARKQTDITILKLAEILQVSKNTILKYSKN